MLSEFRKSYEYVANQIPNWNQLSKSELCYRYVDLKDHNDSKADIYLSGLIAKFLKKAEVDYNLQPYKVITEENYYDLVVESIMYVLDKRIWDNPDSKLYHKSDSPEIAINMCLKSNKVNLYVYLQRDKRKLNQGIISLDGIQENASEGYFIPYEDEDISAELYIKNLVKDYFQHKNYLDAFILDAVFNRDVFSDKNNTVEFNQAKLRSAIKSIDESYCKFFSRYYNIDLQEVKDSLKYVVNLTYTKLDTSINKLFKVLRNDKQLSLILHDAY